MTQQYPAGWRFRNVILAKSLLLVVLGWLLGGSAQAQSGPYGNEWIVAGQPYYKIKVWRDGIYRLDYTYLQSLSGAAGIAPTRFQVWRRGKEVALYQGGNQATLDATSYLEFYGQRNDGALDREFYKDPNEQAHKYYSFYTDTAAYFITWGTRAGKRMVQPTAAGGTPHAWRMQTVVKVATDRYFEAPTAGLVHMPWLNSSEGFFSLATPRPGYGGPLVLSNDSLLRALVTTGSAPPIRAEVCLIGGSIPSAGGGILGQHNGSVLVGPPGGTPRQLGVLTFMNYDYKRGYYVLNPSDIGSTGKVEISSAVVGQRNATPVDVIAQSYMKLTAAQQNVWFSDRRSLWFQNDSLLSGPATYELDNIPGTVVGYDIHDPYNVQRVAPTAAQTLGSTGRRFVFPDATSAQTRRLYLADATVWLTPAAPRRVNFKAINPVTPNFVIITHPKLMKAAGTVPNAALEYAKYRASAVGGAYDTLIVTSPQLYDQFHYGERSVIALRHFALWLANAAPATQTKYLLLLGKGIGSGVTPGMVNVSGYFGVDANYTTRKLGDMGLDLVPTSTNAASDNFLSADWPNDNLVAKLPTGRVPAATPQEVMSYLAKLREHEALGIADWRKNVLHLAGGLSPAEYVQFGSYLDGHAKRVPRPLLGGNVKTIRKSGPDPVVTANIANELNGGLSVIQYFGHGSPNYFNLEIGDINDPATNYHNAGRYPVLMYNGCEAGDCFFTPMTFGPSWLLASQKGSIGMLSQSCEAYAYLLDPAQDMMYKLLFNDPDWFGQPVTRVYGEMVRRMQTDTRFQGNPAGTEQLLATTWMGDPALRLYAPAKPDFIASNATLSVVPAAGSSTVSPTAPFALKIGVSNPARITTDSVEIRVTRTYDPATGRAPETRTRTFRQAWLRDTTYTFGLDNTGNVYGFNTFKVELDYRSKVAELDETNNTATTTYSFLRGSLTLLTPTEFAIINNNRPRLTAQNNDPNAVTRSYDFEVDTVATFNSNKIQRGTVTSAPSLVSWQPPTALVGAKPDSVVWYWRVRLSAPTAAEDASWKVSSFRIISSVAGGGWSQSHYDQFKRDQLQQTAVAAPAGRWTFADQRLPIGLITAGGGAPGASSTFSGGYGILTDLSAPPVIGTCGAGSPNLMVLVLDGRSLQRLAVPGGPYSTCGSGTQTFYHFGSTVGDTLDNLNNSAARQQQLVTFLQNVPDGSYVALVSMNRLRYAAFPASLRSAFAQLLGSQLITTQLRNGEPWTLVAKKLAMGGTLVGEHGPDRSLSQSTFTQLVSVVDTVRIPSQAGKVLSTRIGPATEWQALFNVIKRETTASSYTLRLLGVDGNNMTQVLQPDIKAKTLSLTNVPAATYPYLQLEVTLRDSVTRVPPQLRQWLVTYKGLPEGAVRRDLVAAAAYDPATLAVQAADSGYIRFPVKFENIGGIDFAQPLTTRLDLVNSSGVTVKSVTFTAATVLKAGDVMTVPVKMNVVGIFGTLTPVVTVNPTPNQQPELYFFNNTLALVPYSIIDRNVPPTLDVAFDGRHLLNGDIVSPTPAINIQLRDEDKFRHIKNASYFTVLLQKPGAATATLISPTSPELQFSADSTSQNGTVARLEYHPGKSAPLDNGVYTLQVQGRDPSSNAAGTQNYQVKFEVVKQSTITNVFPYPNPVTSKARFVFTVTGQELPRDMKIQIMTLTGQVVREIFMGELGPLHIGNNITDYAWDGTDQYGDRLANGTYLYRVSLNDPSGQFSQRATAGDQAFKKDWGKLVLLR